jgi:hypothetical protein
MHPNPLTWALVIATHKRNDVLANGQTRPPLEIVVVDASPRWENTRERVLREIAPLWPKVRWHNLEAERRSSASQRNQGIRAASTDVVFLFDDDSLMYPDCAAEIMRVYDADSGRSVVGVNATNVAVPPDASPEGHVSAPTEFTIAKNYGPVARWVRRIFPPFSTMIGTSPPGQACADAKSVVVMSGIEGL